MTDGEQAMAEKFDRKFDSNAEKIERTGDNTFNVLHDDGSIFECKGTKPVVEKLSKADHPRVKISIPVGVQFDKNGKRIA